MPTTYYVVSSTVQTATPSSASLSVNCIVCELRGRTPAAFAGGGPDSTSATVKSGADRGDGLVGGGDSPPSRLYMA